MPKQRDLKRLARDRKKKTGESYTTARMHLLARRNPGPQKDGGTPTDGSQPATGDALPENAVRTYSFDARPTTVGALSGYLRGPLGLLGIEPTLVVRLLGSDGGEVSPAAQELFVVMLGYPRGRDRTEISLGVLSGAALRYLNYSEAEELHQAHRSLTEVSGLRVLLEDDIYLWLDVDIPAAPDPTAMVRWVVHETPPVPPFSLSPSPRVSSDENGGWDLSQDEYDMLEDNRVHYVDARVQAVADWFFEHFKDPAEGVPYESQEGGYQYYDGGPIDPWDALADAPFDYPEFVMERIAQDLATYGGNEWVSVDSY